MRVGGRVSRVCGEARLGRWCVVPMRLGCKRASSASTLGRVLHFFRNSLPVVACAPGHCDEQQQQQQQRNATSREELQLPAMRAPSDSWAAPGGIVRLVICSCLAPRSALPDGRIKRAKCTLSRARLAPVSPVSPAGPLRLPDSCTWTGTCTVALLAQLAPPVLGLGFGFGFMEKNRKGKKPGQMSGCVSPLGSSSGSVTISCRARRSVDNGSTPFSLFCPPPPPPLLVLVHAHSHLWTLGLALPSTQAPLQLSLWLVQDTLLPLPRRLLLLLLLSPLSPSVPSRLLHHDAARFASSLHHHHIDHLLLYHLITSVKTTVLHPIPRPPSPRLRLCKAALIPAVSTLHRFSLSLSAFGFGHRVSSTLHSRSVRPCFKRLQPSRRHTARSAQLVAPSVVPLVASTRLNHPRRQHDRAASAPPLGVALHRCNRAQLICPPFPSPPISLSCLDPPATLSGSESPAPPQPQPPQPPRKRSAFGLELALCGPAPPVPPDTPPTHQLH